MEADAFMGRVETLVARSAELTPLDAAVLLALGARLATDTRAFARLFGVAHALVLRTVAGLDGRFVTVTSRDPRTQRTRLELTDLARALMAGAPERAAAKHGDRGDDRFPLRAGENACLSNPARR